MPIDPELVRQVSVADSDDTIIDVTVTLATPPGKKVLSASETESAVSSIIERVREETQRSPAHVKVLHNLQSFGVRAAAGFLRPLLAQPEIAGAIANVQAEDDLMIRPVNERAAELGDVALERVKRAGKSPRRKDAP